MNKKVKILAMYLPQYHVIPENSRFWGDGFTDWVSVKKATPLFDGHIQPRGPLNDYYYDLSNAETVKWQVELAKEYGIYGFGIYHYWFSNDVQLLTKPAEILLRNQEFNIPFFFAWDNASWRRTWSKLRGNAWAPLSDDEQKGKSDEKSSILVEYKLGEKPDWKKHFEYLLEFFNDSRYIKVDGKPLFSIYNYSPKIEEMAEYWNELAIENGFEGMFFLYKKSVLNQFPKEHNNFNYEPTFSGFGDGWRVWAFKALSMLNIIKRIGPIKYSYDSTWEKIIATAKKRISPNEWHGAFVSYDDTPRRGKQGRLFIGDTPEKFCHYMKQLIEICKTQNKEFILLTAWNEWGEGAMLEPSNKDGYKYLEVIRELQQ